MREQLAQLIALQLWQKGTISTTPGSGFFLDGRVEDETTATGNLTPRFILRGYREFKKR